MAQHREQSGDGPRVRGRGRGSKRPEYDDVNGPKVAAALGVIPRAVDRLRAVTSAGLKVDSLMPWTSGRGAARKTTPETEARTAELVAAGIDKGKAEQQARAEYVSAALSAPATTARNSATAGREITRGCTVIVGSGDICGVPVTSGERCGPHQNVTKVRRADSVINATGSAYRTRLR